MSREKSSGESRWKYLVLLAKFGVHFLFVGVPKSLSVLIPSLIVEFDLDYASAGFLVSLQYGTVYLAGKYM